MSNPSRNDKQHLLTGWAGNFFNDDCLRPEYNINQIDLRTIDTLSEGLLPNTRGLLLLGERALHFIEGYKGYNLNEQRGCPLTNKWNLPCIASYLPQDAVDFQDHESRLNELAAKDETHEKEDETEKHKGKTSRENYQFWLIQDTKKILRRITASNSSCISEFTFNYSIYPSSDTVIEWLRSIKNTYVYLDIETDKNLQLNCIGIGSNKYIFVIPINRYNYSLAYNCIPKIFQALAICFRDNTVVCHNSLFDLLILTWKYHLPIGVNQYDTMLAWHKCYPEAEKSLGHVMSSQLMWEPYHKDEGVFNPNNTRDEYKLWEYNAKDIYGTRLAHQSIEQYAKTQPGLTESIKQTNDCIRPFLISTLQGMRYDNDKLINIVKENDRLCEQYTRMIRLALGDDLYDSIQGQSKANLAASHKQVTKYFHDIMDYKIVSRTKAGAACLDADNMYKLKLKYPNNFIINLILSYRERAKETGSLKFKPWRT